MLPHHAIYRPGTRREIAIERLYFRWLYRARRKTGEEPSTEAKLQKIREIKGTP